MTNIFLCVRRELCLAQELLWRFGLGEENPHIQVCLFPDRGYIRSSPLFHPFLFLFGIFHQKDQISAEVIVVHFQYKKSLGCSRYFQLEVVQAPWLRFFALWALKPCDSHTSKYTKSTTCPPHVNLLVHLLVPPSSHHHLLIDLPGLCNFCEDRRTQSSRTLDAGQWTWKRGDSGLHLEESRGGGGLFSSQPLAFQPAPRPAERQWFFLSHVIFSDEEPVHGLAPVNTDTDLGEWPRSGRPWSTSANRMGRR